MKKKFCILISLTILLLTACSSGPSAPTDKMLDKMPNDLRNAVIRSDSKVVDINYMVENEEKYKASEYYEYLILSGKVTDYAFDSTVGNTDFYYVVLDNQKYHFDIPKDDIAIGHDYIFLIENYSVIGDSVSVSIKEFYDMSED